ncbi:organic hydroperoxide resistance protein [Paludibacter sp. 221]|uniref:organic hydroperoxide resistance protein n=1 Tax=Paludibacter sp. 221 TaxID=2302939 RepID=UPI0013D82BC8|nr:organic hydroperoxide resistance protein [Paludibacter sp. 221]NDV46829.1 organic hydroperoxide resistance protein [Paludibacter sp. 221]
MKALYTAVATTIGGRAGHVKSSDGLLDFDLRPPKEMGGPDGAYTNPEQLFAAGYSACFGSALSHVALEKKIRIKPDVTAKVSIGNKEGGGFMLAVEMDINIPEVDQKTAEELAKEAHQICPYSNATRNNIDVKLNVKGK